jgi:prepilin-type N-terminal cleavage/methylation domain-containing protein
MGTRLIHKGQRGFTLIELVIVIGLTGLIAGGLTLTIFQVFNMDARTRNDMTAVYQVRQAGKLVSQDILEARNVEPGGTSGFPLTLTWTDYETNYTHTVVYTLVDMPSGEFKRLKREHYIQYDTEDPVLDSTTIVAEYIDLGQTSIYPVQPCYFPNCGVFTYKFKVTATVGEQSEARVYEVKPRPGS